MVTIKDVAVKAGVSVTTVSRVMNNRGPLSESTKKAVYDAMEELDYLPNDLARALGKNSLNLIGLIVPSIRHPYFAQLVHQFEYECSLREYKLIVFACDYDYEKEKRCIELMRRTMVDGIIYTSHSEGKDFLENLQVPAVTLENRFAGLPAILSDNRQGGYLAARHLIARECKNLICIGGQLDLRLPSDERINSFRRECEKQGVPCKVYSATDAMLSEMEYGNLISQVFTENPDMDGIFASSDVIAAQCIQAATAFGYKIPEQLKIVGFDDIFMSRLMNPPLTTVRQNTNDMVKAAVEVLMMLMEGKKDVPETQTIPITFVERRTT